MNTELIKKAAQTFDNDIDFKETIKNLFKNSPAWQKFVSGVIANYIEKNDDRATEYLLTELYTRIDSEYHQDIDNILLSYVRRYLTGIEMTVTDRLVKAVKTPLGDEMEREIISGLLSIILGCMRVQVERMTKDDTVGGGGPGGDPDGGKG